MKVWPYNLYSVYRRQIEFNVSNYFQVKGYDVQVKYPYILKDRSNWKQNIILKSVSQYLEAKKKDAAEKGDPFPIHKYIHHGLSSQAMLFNLFGEPVILKDYKFFQDVFQFSDIKIDNHYELKFEHSSRKTFNEEQQQPTSFDFAVYDPTSMNKNIFVEAKLVETEFGGCSVIAGGDCDGLNPLENLDFCYLTHKGRNYWELMLKHGLDKAYINSPICPFALYYQFYRELMFALENNGYYVILIDKRNPAFEKKSKLDQRGLIPILINLIHNELRNQIKILYIQDILPILEKHGYTWVGEFNVKYGM